MKLFGAREARTEAEEEEVVEGERALSPVNKSVTLQNRITNWFVIAAAVTLAAFFLYDYYSNLYNDYQKAKATPKDSTRVATTVSLPPLVMPPPETTVRNASALTAESQLPPLTAPAPQHGQSDYNTPAKTVPKKLSEIVRDRRLKKELRFNFDQRSARATSNEDISGSGETDGIARQAVTQAPKPLTDSNPTSARRAFLLPEPTLMIPKGRPIPCNVMPAVDTTLKGSVTCIVDEDIRGADNKVVLINRGTQCFGRQEGGLTQGMRRIGIIWNQCLTDENVVIPMASAATDSLGRPGITGQVDNHFWDRFGAAIALSLISDVGPYLIATQQSRGDNSTTVTFPVVGTGPQQIMTEVLKSTVDIPPTLIRPQGARVLIFLADDLDFRDVYVLETKK